VGEFLGVPDGTMASSCHAGTRMAENSPPCADYADFARGRPTRVVGRGATDADRALAVQRALSRVGERGYSLIGGNCEHFTTWCATGVAASQQVVDWISAETTGSAPKPGPSTWLHLRN
jgi:lecithin:retinol acyltransferase